MQSIDNILPYNGEVYYFKDVFSPLQCEKYLTELQSEIRWKHEPIKIFGKEIMQPRLTAWYGDEGRSYTYSGVTMEANSWTENLAEIKSAIQDITRSTYNSALLNLYRDGKDSIGWHRDNEKMLGIAPVIASVSFGVARTFQLRNYNDKKIIRSIDLAPGSVLLMKGETQRHWQHRLPVAKKTSSPRLNITFRTVLPA
jgi:alkylated DNA repair dioxygenase AlkB